MSETNIRTLLKHWEKLQLTDPTKRGFDFEQKRLRVIEQIARSFVDYFNENKFSAPYRLMLINIDNAAIIKDDALYDVLDRSGQEPDKEPKDILQLKAYHAAEDARDAIINNEASMAMAHLEKTMDLLKCRAHLGNSPWDPR